jgi:hypothetical protein
MASTANQYSFAPTGNSIRVEANVAAPIGVQCPVRSVNDVDSGTYRFVNAANETIFIGVGATAAEAQANAEIILTSQRAIPIAAGSTTIMRFSQDAYFSAIAVGGKSNLYITPGQGI